MEIINISKNSDKNFKLYFKYIFYKFFIKVYIISVILTIALFTYIFINIPSELNDVKSIFLITLVPALTLSIIVIRFLIKLGIKNRLFKNESIFEYKFTNYSLDLNKTEKGVTLSYQIEYSIILSVIETEELFILNTKFNSFPTLIIDKDEFISGTSASLSAYLKNKIKNFKQTFKCNV